MKPLPAQYDRRKNESQLRDRWARDDAFKWDPSLPAELDYVIDTPPPTVSGTLHVGHVYSYTQADIVARYFRMSGRNVLYPVGWDDNGLPTERLVEKIKKVRGGSMQREEFVKLCREVIPVYEDQFRSLFSRLALSVDWSREYQTISNESRAISQLSFLDLYNKGLLTRRLEPTLWDPADRTAIAQAEVEELERDGLIYTIAFGLESGGELIIATTRPELIGACGAVMIHPDDPRFDQLRGRHAISPLYGVPVPIIADDQVDPEKGTGAVMCCTFGDVTDIRWWRTHGLPLRIVIDGTGRMSSSLPIGQPDWPSVDVAAARATMQALAGLKIEQARAQIIELLDAGGLLRGRASIRQIVPVAERSRAPLEIMVTAQWFIRTLDFKDDLIAKGREIEWRPEFMRQRFESWVEGLKWDWSISRQRHFGVPLPVWYSKRAGEEGAIIVPAPDELPVDPTVDTPRGYRPHEVEGDRDVLDTWATSSVSPQLLTRTINEQLGADQELHRRLFPMAMRPQAHEIIRTWAFYTIVKAMHHQNSIPWRNICISGWCLASDGSKMSKSKGNVIDPIKLLDEYGSDAVRYWTGTSRLGHDTALAPTVLKVGSRLSTKLWNAARLANIALLDASLQPTTPKGDMATGKICYPLDQWLLGRLGETIVEATSAFENYEYSQALRSIEEFFWKTYCDNYLEFVKWRTDASAVPSEANRSALYTLHHATMALTRLFAPFLPYICEAINDAFGANAVEESTVHARGGWPRIADQVDSTSCRELGDTLVDLIFGVRKIKSELNLSIRAPVDELVISHLGAADGALQNSIDLIGRDLKETANVARIRVGEDQPALPSTETASGKLKVALRLSSQANG